MDSNELALNAPGVTVKDDAPMVDMVAMRQYRLKRLQAQIQAADCAAAVLFSPINIRYATGTRSAQVSSMHLLFRCAVVPARGGVTLFGWGGVDTWTPETIAETRAMPVFNYFPAGARSEARVKRFVGDIEDIVEGKRIAVDITVPEVLQTLESRGFEVLPAQPMKEHAAVIKSQEEIDCMVRSCTVAEVAMARMRAALEPGLTENDLSAVLHHTNISMGGEWIEYRLLASGGHINPWLPEADDKIIRPGELVAFDCGLVGPLGYSADVSRTFRCGPGRPTEKQRGLYKLAYENIQQNLELIKPGISFKELSDRSWMPPDEYILHRYPVMMHGIGMTDEWPSIPWPIDWEEDGYDGVLEENMAVCIESFIGSEHGGEGVKLEEQIVVTRDGYQRMSTFPFEDELLA
jgi:Xaa-Pro dipeptidase